jgi:hypothetical protein
MYSYEDRLSAVQLYIKLGKRIGLTIRQLGYRRALRDWAREGRRRQCQVGGPHFGLSCCMDVQHKPGASSCNRNFLTFSGLIKLSSIKLASHPPFRRSSRR